LDSHIVDNVDAIPIKANSIKTTKCMYRYLKRVIKPGLNDSFEIESYYCLLAHGAAGLDLLEEVVTFVVNEDEGREVFNFYLPDGFHAEFGIFKELYVLDRVLGKDSGGTADRAEVETAMLLASIGNLLRTIAFCDHDH